MKLWRKHQRSILIGLLFVGFFFLLGFFKRYHVPRIKQWLLVEVEAQSRKRLPLRIWPKEVDIDFFPISATFQDVRVLPQKDLQNVIVPFQIEKLRVSLSMWALFSGQIRIGQIHAAGATVEFTLPDNAIQRQSKGHVSLQSISKIPLNQILIERFKISTHFKTRGLSTQIEDLNLNIENKFKTFRAAFSASGMKIRTSAGAELQGNIESQCLIDKEGVYFSNLKISRGHSYVSGTGSLTGDIFASHFDNLRAKISGDLNLQEVRQIAVEFIDPKKTPDMTGSVRFETDFDYKLSGPLRASFLINAEELKIHRFDIGSLQLIGKTDEKKINVSKATVRNNFGNLFIENGSLNFADKMAFNATLAADSLELSLFLRSLGIPRVPVYTHIDGSLPCSGHLKDNFSVTCSGALKGRDLSVTVGTEDPFTIVAFKTYGAEGSVTVDEKAVSYKAGLQIGSSRGESDGVISYADGFKINYSTPQLRFADIIDLAHLKPEGAIAIKGQTAGDKHTATVDLKASVEKFWLSDFALGQGQFVFRYRTGNLFFDKMEMQVGSSRINGDMQIDVHDKQLRIDGTAPFLDAEDLVSVFKRKVQIPFTVTGTGSAKIKLNGPLDSKSLSFELSSALYRGMILDETYDQFHFNVKSRQGHIETQKVELVKGKSRIHVTGDIKPEGLMNLSVRGRQFQIEQSEYVSRLKTNLTGNLEFDMGLTGHILKPNIELVGQISQIMLGDYAADDSEFSLRMNEREISGSARFLGEALLAKFNRSHEKSGSTRMELKTNRWNFGQTFSVFSESLRGGSYQTDLSSHLRLEIPNDEPFNFSGELTIKELLLRNGRAELISRRPLNMTAKNGVINAEDFEILGDNTYIRIKSSATEARQLALTLEGRLDMTLASLFTPFLEDIRGLLNFSFALGGSYAKPVLTGSSYIEDGFFKLKGFPHPAEQVQGDAIFNNEKIIINAVKGKIGGGLFSANGQIQIHGLNNLPIHIKGQFQDAKFNVPDGFNTRGNGEFFMRGSWFPYTLGVSYNIESGTVERRAAESKKAAPDVKPSAYLPKSISSQRFSPIHLALDINIRKMIPVKMTISRVDIRTEVNGQMKVAGPPDTPLLTGKVNIARGGKVTFRNNTFEIRSGSVEYSEASPINPTLNIQADARVIAYLKKNDETREYDVDMRIQGTAQSPKISMSSQPPLPENDLISLLTLGFINETQADGNEATSELAATSYQLGSAFLTEQLGINRVLESRLGVQFDINSSYDSTEKADKPKFTLRKQWSPKFGTTASRTIGKTNTNNVRADYKLNKNLSVIGEWEGQEFTGSEQAPTTGKDQNIFGLDIEYKVDFK